MPDLEKKSQTGIPLMLVRCDSLEQCEQYYGKAFRTQVEAAMSAGAVDVSSAARQIHVETYERNMKTAQAVLNAPLDGAPPSEVWK